MSGRRRAVVRQTALLDRSALVPRGVFILDTRDVVFIWIGKDSDTAERLQATKVYTSIFTPIMLSLKILRFFLQVFCYKICLLFLNFYCTTLTASDLKQEKFIIVRFKFWP